MNKEYNVYIPIEATVIVSIEAETEMTHEEIRLAAIQFLKDEGIVTQSNDIDVDDWSYEDDRWEDSNISEIKRERCKCGNHLYVWREYKHPDTGEKICGQCNYNIEKCRRDN